MSYYYIIGIECPLSKTIVSLTKSKHDQNPKVNGKVSEMPAYISWRAKLKRKRKSPILSILDHFQGTEGNASNSDSDLILEHYRWQFKSWGFDLFENRFVKRNRDLENEFATLLGSKINNLSLKIKREFFNYKLLILFTKDLCTHARHSRALDEITLLVILTFFFGERPLEISNYTIFDLEKSTNSFISKYGKSYMRTFTSFTEKFIDSYQDNIINKAFKLIEPTNSKLNNRKLRVLQHSIGYDLRIDFENSYKISQILSREYHKNIDPYHEDVKSWIELGLKEYINVTKQDRYIYNDLFPYIYMSSLPLIDQCELS